MNVFLSWSGDKSRAAAEEFNQWIQCVLQSIKPWISTSGIEGGSLWFDEISTKLNETGIGIIFLTHENKNSPWIMFESGALAKGLKVNRVCTLLIDLEPQDINNPLANFNHTFTTKDSIHKLTKMLNSMLDEKSLSTPVLDKVYEKYWPDLELAFQQIENHSSPIGPEPQRDSEDKLDEILLSTRKIANRVDMLEREHQLLKIEQRYSKRDNNINFNDDVNEPKSSSWFRTPSGKKVYLKNNKVVRVHDTPTPTEEDTDTE